MNTNPGEKKYFRETQYYRQRWILLLLMAAAAISWYRLLTIILFDNAITENPLHVWTSVTLWVIFGLIFPIILFLFRLVTEVGQDGLQIHFQPFFRRKINYSDIKSSNPVDEIQPEDQGFLRIRFGWGTPAVYHISGNKGININLHNGETILLGSEEPEKLAKAISRQLSNKLNKG